MGVPHQGILTISDHLSTMSTVSDQLSPVKPALGRVALVTGSARGIGKAIALRLARDGHDIVINDIQANKAGIDETVKDVEAIGRKAVGMVCDVSDFEAVKKMIADIFSQMGRLDVSVAYAPGIVGTAMWDLIDGELGKLNGRGKGETKAHYVNDLTSLGRESVPEDVAKAVSFLASDDSEFITGQTLMCDGGIQFC